MFEERIAFISWQRWRGLRGRPPGRTLDAADERREVHAEHLLTALGTGALRGYHLNSTADVLYIYLYTYLPTCLFADLLI